MNAVKVLFVALLFIPIISGADNLVFKTTFAPDADPRKVIDESPFAHHGKLTGKAAFTGATGDRRVMIDGSDGSLMIIPPAEHLNPRDEFTVSLWFCAKDLPTAKKGLENTGNEYSLFNRGWQWRLHFRGSGNKNVETGTMHLFFYSTTKDVYSQTDIAVPLLPGRWHHAAFALSGSKSNCTVFINGCPVTSFKLNPLPDCGGTPITLGSDPGNCFVFNGEIAGVKMFAKALNENEINANEQDFLKRRIQSLERDAPVGNLRQSITNTLAKKVIPIDDYCRLQHMAARASNDRQLAESGQATNANFVAYVVKPFRNNPILPDSIIPRENCGTELKIFVTPGEYEPASFVLRPRKDILNFIPVPGALTNAAGKVIPATAIDIKIVKVWYECVGRFKTEDDLVYTKGVAAARKLTPEILINDDSLVKVDFDQQEQYLRLSYKFGWGPGKKYVWISEVDDSLQFRYPIPADQYPILDSPKLLPLNLKKDFNQQYFVTIRPPSNAVPGLYRGKIALMSGEEQAGAFDLTVRVLPFKLPTPKTNYDLEREFTSAIDYWTIPVESGPGSISSNGRNKQQYIAELKDLLAHNVSNPYQLAFFGYSKTKPELTTNEYEHVKNILKWRREAGLPTRPVYMGPGNNLDFFSKANFKTFRVTPEILRQLKDLVKKNLDLVEEVYGHRDVYFYAIDEAVGDMLAAELPLWKAIQEAGGKVIVCGQHKSVGTVAGALDILTCAWKPLTNSAAAMHAGGGKIWMYAYPQGGRVNPMPYRINFGFLVYKANYDGNCDYAYYTSSADPWNDFDNGREPDLGFVYPTANGVVDTIAWEGYREAIDDIRYATAFRERLAAVRAKGSAEQKALADEAEKWFDADDPSVSDFDPDSTRERIVAWMLKLGDAQ